MAEGTRPKAAKPAIDAATAAPIAEMVVEPVATRVAAANRRNPRSVLTKTPTRLDATKDTAASLSTALAEPT